MHIHMLRLGVPYFLRVLFLVQILAISHSTWAKISNELPDHQNVIFQEVIDGEVEFENFTYYIVDSNEDIVLNLTSLLGDCDLYISQARRAGENPPNPTIDTHNYDLQSTTCGEDVITINKDILRPFCIGIYAHPSHNFCSYHLEITGTKSEQLDFPSDVLQNGSENGEQTSESSEEHPKSERKQKKHAPNTEGNELESFLELLLNIAIQFLGVIFEVLL